jgi:hypothetical protein
VHNKEKYYLVADLNYSPLYIVNTYKKRFFIEETFRDYKSGMGFEKYSNGINEKRLLALLCTYTLAYMFMYEMSKDVVKDKRYSFYTKFKNETIYKIARNVFFELLNEFNVTHRHFK